MAPVAVAGISGRPRGRSAVAVGSHSARPAEKPPRASVSPFLGQRGGRLRPPRRDAAGPGWRAAAPWHGCPPPPLFLAPRRRRAGGGLPGPTFCPAEGAGPGGAARQPRLGHSPGQGTPARRARAEPVPWTPLSLQQPPKAAGIPRGHRRGVGGSGGVGGGATASRRAGEEPAPGRG